MFLKYLSIPELDFNSSWNKGFSKLKKLNKFDRFMIFFWFIGPFIYLIERSPADIWLSIISLVFIIRCIIKSEWFWTKQLWFSSC